jgi:hypothetical protein
MIEQLTEALNEAMEAMLKALAALLLALLILLARSAQAILTLARIALPLAAAAAAGAGAVMLFTTVMTAYGNDPPAALLALVAVTATPTALLLLAQQRGKELTLWGILAGSGALMLLARLAIERAPPVVTALAPSLGLAASIFYMAFGQRPNQTQEQNQQPNEGSTNDG